MLTRLDDDPGTVVHRSMVRHLRLVYALALPRLLLAPVDVALAFGISSFHERDRHVWTLLREAVDLDRPVAGDFPSRRPRGVGYFPLNAVRWLPPPRDIAALVTDSGRDRFTAELFHFGKDTRALAAELYLLARGDYRLTLAPADGRSVPLSSRAITVKGPYTRVSLDLPPQRLCTLNITHR